VQEASREWLSVSVWMQEGEVLELDVVKCLTDSMEQQRVNIAKTRAGVDA